MTTGTPVNVTAGATTGGIDFALATGGRITGTVTDVAANTPVEDAYVNAYSASGSYVAGGFTDASGAYALVGLTAGKYYVRTRNSAYLDALYQRQAVFQRVL